MTPLALALALAAPQADAPPAPPPPVAQAPAPVDPARLPAARRVADRLLPPGTMALLMKGSMDMVANSAIDRMYDLPLRDFAKLGGLEEEKLTALGPVTLKQIMEVMDPNFAERQRITMRVMGTEIGAFMATLEPEYRAGLADALARRFDQSQLGELDRFFATPTGSTYAAQSMLLYVDPGMMARMQSLMPRMMEAMPEIMAKVMAATASLPKPRSYDTLTQAEKDKLKALIGPATP